MASELKFRAWDKINKNLFIVSAIQGIDKDESSEYKYVSGRYYNVVDWKDAEIMQFTGLKDKNGKEIYEGDIVNWCGSKIAVQFRLGIFGAEERSGFRSLLDISYWVSPNILGNFEIIGNIYENPELINE